MATKKAKKDEQVSMNEYLHITYREPESNKVYRTADILVAINPVGCNNGGNEEKPACRIYDIHTKKLLHEIHNITINQITISEFGNEYIFEGLITLKNNKKKTREVQVYTDSHSKRKCEFQDLQLFTAFELADAFSDDYTNFLCKPAKL